MIKLITAPSTERTAGALRLFLAGGITKCPDWQQDVVRRVRFLLDGLEADVDIYNPRQERFDMSDPLASEHQIQWEFDRLSAMDAFTMFFYGPTESDQPICFYELGRYLRDMQARFPGSWRDRIVVTTCSEFRRKADVVVQTHLATGVLPNVVPGYDAALDYHALCMAKLIRNLSTEHSTLGV